MYVWMYGWVDGCDFLKALGVVGEGESERILGCMNVCVCVNLGSRPSICPHLYPALHVKAFWAHHAKSPRVWKWKRKCDYESISIVNTQTHTPSHMQLYSKQADVSSTAPPPPKTTAATLISGTSSHGGVNSDWWGGSASRPPDLFQLAARTGRQAGRLSDTCEYIKIHGREITAEQRSDWLQPLQTLKKCCWVQLYPAAPTILSWN